MFITLRRKLGNVEVDINESLIAMIDDVSTDHPEDGCILLIAGQKVAVTQSRTEVRSLIAMAKG